MNGKSADPTDVSIHTFDRYQSRESDVTMGDTY